jgi:hypothetical protein
MDQNTSTQQLFDACGVAVIGRRAVGAATGGRALTAALPDNVLEGRHGTVFAYGATGSGTCLQRVGTARTSTRAHHRASPRRRASLAPCQRHLPRARTRRQDLHDERFTREPGCGSPRPLAAAMPYPLAVARGVTALARWLACPRRHDVPAYLAAVRRAEEARKSLHRLGEVLTACAFAIHNSPLSRASARAATWRSTTRTWQTCSRRRLCRSTSAKIPAGCAQRPARGCRS